MGVGGRVTQEEETAHTVALRQEHTWPGGGNCEIPKRIRGVMSAIRGGMGFASDCFPWVLGSHGRFLSRGGLETPLFSGCSVQDSCGSFGESCVPVVNAEA